MKRIIVLGFILLSISSLAFSEAKEPLNSSYKIYSVKISQYKVIIVTPLDNKRSVLIGIQEKGQKEPASYLAENIGALAISRLAKMTAKIETDKKIKKYAKGMVQARALAMKVDD